MKVYFEDGRLVEHPDIDFDAGCWVIDARFGFNNCYDRLVMLKAEEDINRMHSCVYTNFSAALNNRFAWNKELQVPEIYLRRNGDWVRVDELTDRELREGHNIEKMWISGAFE